MEFVLFACAMLLSGHQSPGMLKKLKDKANQVIDKAADKANGNEVKIKRAYPQMEEVILAAVNLPIKVGQG
jgi:hypothetical protein